MRVLWKLTYGHTSQPGEREITKESPYEMIFKINLSKYNLHKMKCMH